MPWRIWQKYIKTGALTCVLAQSIFLLEHFGFLQLEVKCGIWDVSLPLLQAATSAENALYHHPC